MIERNCRICGSDDVTLVYATARDYLTGDAFQVWQCRRCTVAFTAPIPADLTPYYPAQYRRYNPLILGILKLLYRRRAKQWAGGFREAGVAFELGCGDGLMLDTLRSLGWQVMGNERTLQAAQFAGAHLKLPVFVGGLEAVRPGPVCDLIFLFQVLEHLDDPAGVIRHLSQFLKPNGKLIIAVPNFGGGQSRFARAQWFHLDVPRHLFHFSLRSLQICLESAGLEIEQSSCISLEHDPFGWIQSLLNRYTHTHNRLTRLLMRIDDPDAANLWHLALAAILGPVSIALACVSWPSRRGAVVEIIARKAKG